ncbi:GNAT family N-acetyltransferase [Caulobacter vibrioides]|uniref:Acetyltransferase, GNAT family n=2 Tax=Caulobacter vibrioides TaxID=155892 RepID=Q9A6T8_CAUVC|nr:GNAT family N-acetyltransferase [Caulobacter vibrioides]YP_002517447.1 IAA acetyltransferase [Caulobacter vibrioides NA1000]AAK23970.1 acetyltransferase, GNAT family [Caulobacter vibrioides CB15]ACL95539.1 IAA acetyltransferase [Caulobacter vibrioides NA1000]ATC28868.1 N-acetyltransferase [Caulobacter vibrioides]QXZ50380.1 GNAT family N-acetyltransferase [Caulobacter vibrioides]
MPKPQLRIIAGDFEDPRIIALLAHHFATMRSTGPEESCHVMPLGTMRQADLDFFAAWDGDALAGFGAVKQLGDGHGEIKSMHTAAAYRGRGVGQAVLDHLSTHARALGLQRLSLETGAGDFFVPARAMYARNGFQTCDPFGDYKPDPNSVFMTRML